MGHAAARLQPARRQGLDADSACMAARAARHRLAAGAVMTTVCFVSIIVAINSELC